MPPEAELDMDASIKPHAVDAASASAAAASLVAKAVASSTVRHCLARVILTALWVVEYRNRYYERRNSRYMEKSTETQGEGNGSVLLWMLFTMENHSFFYRGTLHGKFVAIHITRGRKYSHSLRCFKKCRRIACTGCLYSMQPHVIMRPHPHLQITAPITYPKQVGSKSCSQYRTFKTELTG